MGSHWLRRIYELEFNFDEPSEEIVVAGGKDATERTAG